MRNFCAHCSASSAPSTSAVRFRPSSSMRSAGCPRRTETRSLRPGPRRAFLVFTAQLLDDFDAYLDDPNRRGPADDVVGYRQVALDLTDAKVLDLVGEMAQLFARYAELGPGPGRRRRLISRVIMPARDAGDPSPEE